MLCGLVIGLRALTLNERLHRQHTQSLNIAEYALQTQQQLARLQLVLDTNNSTAPTLAQFQRSISSLNALINSLVDEQSCLACQQVKADLLATLEALQKTQALLKEPSTELAQDTQKPRLGVLFSSLEQSLNSLLQALRKERDELGRQAAEFARFARFVLIGTTVVTLFLGLTFAVVAWRGLAANRRLFGQLDQLAHEDSLTGVVNRRGLDQHLPLEINSAEQLGSTLTVVMLDLDHFKRYNDRKGHGAGDSLLRSAAQAWRKQLRPTDMLARYGGEEFTMVLPACDAAQAQALIERLRPLMPDQQTFSAGIATRIAGENAEALLERADHALLLAKRRGRNCSVIAAEEQQIELPLRAA